MSKIMEHHFPKLLGGDYIKGKAISVCMYMQLTSLDYTIVFTPTLPQQASSNTVDLNMNGNMEEQLEEVSQDNYASSSDPEIVSISSSSYTESELEDIY